MPTPSRRIAKALPALLLAAASTALAATAATGAATATGAAAATIGPTTTTTTGQAPANGTVLRTWTFEDGSLGGWAPVGGAPLSLPSSAARSGNRGLQIGLDDIVASYGQGIGITLPGSDFTDSVWYDLNVPVRLVAGAPSIRYRATGPDAFAPASPVTSTAWSTVSAHFRKLPGQNSVTLNLTSVQECATDPVVPPAPAYVDDITLRVAFTQAAITYTKIPCPVATTTTTTTTTTSPSPSGCRVDYAVVSQWSGSFQGRARLTNTSSATIPSWVLGWTFQDGQQVSQSWGTSGHRQSGATVNFNAPGWAPDLAPGASADIGFIASWSGQNRPPTGITVNGRPCGERPTTTTTTTTTASIPTTTTTSIPTTTTTTAVTRRDGCSYQIALPGQPTSPAAGPVYELYLYITGYGLVGQYPDGTISWPDDRAQVTNVRGAESWSQSGRTLSLRGLQWTVGDLDHVTLALAGQSLGLPAGVTVGGVPCSQG